MCLSPDYFHSDYCRWEWEEYLRRRVHQLIGTRTASPPVYFVEVPGGDAQVYRENSAQYYIAILSHYGTVDLILKGLCIMMLQWST